MHYFKNSLAVGKQGEDILNEYFSRWYIIEPVTLSEELKLGIDYIYIDRKTKKRCTVEIKTDLKAIYTGNLFLETEVRQNNDKLSSLGWVAKSSADILIYWAVPTLIYILNMPLLKQEYCKVIENLQQRKIKNSGFYGIGYLADAKDISKYIIAKREVAVSYE